MLSTSKIIPSMLILFIFFSAIAQSSEPAFTTLQAAFRTNESDGNKTEATKGFVFLLASQRIWIRVVEPLHQHMMISQDLLEIYYPDQNLAYFIRSSDSFSYIFISPFIATLRKDYFLTDLKYQLQSFHSESDTLVSVWIPPPELKKTTLTVAIYHCGDKMQKVVTSGLDGKAVKTISFCDYHLVNHLGWFPFSVSVRQKNGDSWLEKHTNLSNVMINATLPDSITRFKIPENAKIKEYKW